MRQLQAIRTLAPLAHDPTGLAESRFWNRLAPASLAKASAPTDTGVALSHRTSRMRWSRRSAHACIPWRMRASELGCVGCADIGA